MSFDQRKYDINNLQEKMLAGENMSATSDSNKEEIANMLSNAGSKQVFSNKVSKTRYWVLQICLSIQITNLSLACQELHKYLLHRFKEV